jgi:hypothetical protein
MDNNKNYKWSPEDKITITGAEFDVFQRTVLVLTEVLTTFLPEAVEVRKTIVERMIAEGIAKEYEESTEVLEEQNGEFTSQPETVINPS